MSGKYSTGDGFDPQRAAPLLTRIGRQLDRELDHPLLVSVLRAAVFLVGYGAIWLTLRGQHPFHGPNRAVLLAVLFAVVTVIITPAKSLREPSAQARAALAIFLSAWPGTALLLGGLEHAGASRGLVYGVLSATGPLIVISLAWAANAATRGEWLEYGLCVGLAAAGGTASFFGPTLVWPVTGIGCAVVFLGHAAVRELMRRRAIAPAWPNAA
jgi:hypothetical protein